MQCAPPLGRPALHTEYHVYKLGILQSAITAANASRVTYIPQGSECLARYDLTAKDAVVHVAVFYTPAGDTVAGLVDPNRLDEVMQTTAAKVVAYMKRLKVTVPELVAELGGAQ